MSWVEIRRHTGRKAEYNSQQSKSDKDGRRVCACIKVDYDQQPFPWVEVWHEDLQGRQTDLQVHTLPAQPDNLTMMVAGPNVHLRVSLHGDTVDNRRPAWVLELVLLNWYTPWPGQGMAGEPEGAVTFIPQEVEVGGVTLQELRQELDSMYQSLKEQIKPQVVQAMARALDKSKYDEDEAVRSYQDRLFKRADDDFYLILNKMITGHDPNHPIDNGPFKALIKKLVGEVLDER